MKKFFALAAVLMLCGFCVAQAKGGPKTVAQILDGGVTAIETELVPAAEAMPEDKFGFAPTNGEFKGVRTFGQQVKHVAAVNYLVAGAILGERPPVEYGGENGPDSVKSKADIMKFLKDSFAYAHKAVATITADNSTASIDSALAMARPRAWGWQRLSRGTGLTTTGRWSSTCA